MSDNGLSDFVMPNGRPPKPHHRVQHGTAAGYVWHSRQRKVEPDHQTCARCKAFWRNRQQAYRQKRRQQMRIIRQVLVGGQAKARLRGNAKDLADLERLINKYATDEQKRELFHD